MANKSQKHDAGIKSRCNRFMALDVVVSTSYINAENTDLIKYGMHSRIINHGNQRAIKKESTTWHAFINQASIPKKKI